MSEFSPDKYQYVTPNVATNKSKFTIFTLVSLPKKLDKKNTTAIATAEITVPLLKETKQAKTVSKTATYLSKSFPLSNNNIGKVNTIKYVACSATFK